MDSKPVFISVLYRSGSTLLSLVLDQSSELNMSYDMIHFMRFSYGKYPPIEENFTSLVEDTSKRVADRWDQLLDVKDAVRRIKAHDKITEAVVYDEMMRSFLSIGPGERWGDRSAVRWTGILPFLEMFPQGKVIHIYRDPRAVLASYKFHTYHKEPMYLDATFAALAMFNYLKRPEIIKNENILLLKYEDLVSAPDEQIKGVCRFLDIEFTDKMLDVGSFTENTGDPFDSNSSFKSNRKSIDKSCIDIWKEKLTRVDIHLTEMILKDKLIEYGYVLSGVDLNKEELREVETLLHSEFLLPRYNYWLETGDGQEAYPDTEGAYR